MRCANFLQNMQNMLRSHDRYKPVSLENERLVSWLRKKMMKAGAIGRLDDVTKLLQTQQKDSQWRMQDIVCGDRPFLRFLTGRLGFFV